MARIVVGMSGGVDSAVAAFLLKQDGHDVIGVTLRTWESGGSRCCEIDSARETASCLGIPYHVINCSPDFKRKVEAPFISGYLHGITPNPCIFCNPEIKWEWMLYAANVYGAEKIATGHYASLTRRNNGLYSIRQAADTAKDQSYMLYRLTQQQLAGTVFPLGELTKEEVRYIALRAGLPSADSLDSQEICFVTKGTYADFIDAQRPDHRKDCGNFVDRKGRILGQHSGITHYTVGQRKGLGLAMGKPVYVIRINEKTNEVVIGTEDDLYKREILCHNMCFSGIPGLDEGHRIRAKVKIRYHDRGTAAWAEGVNKDTVRVEFDTPVRAPTPGQSAVFYDQEHCILGGGIILPDEC